MEMKYILYSKVHTTKEAGNTWTFKFQPMSVIYRKNCSFSVTTTDPFAIMGYLDLPQEIGDIIILDTKKLNTQKKLVNGDKKAVD